MTQTNVCLCLHCKQSKSCNSSKAGGKNMTLSCVVLSRILNRFRGVLTSSFFTDSYCHLLYYCHSNIKASSVYSKHTAVIAQQHHFFPMYRDRSNLLLLISLSR